MACPQGNAVESHKTFCFVNPYGQPLFEQAGVFLRIFGLYCNLYSRQTLIFVKVLCFNDLLNLQTLEMIELDSLNVKL